MHFGREPAARTKTAVDDRRHDVLFASAYLNLAELRGLLPRDLRDVPTVLYFHENQLTYPDRTAGERDRHFGMTNIVSALAADHIVFNTAFHRDDFLSAVTPFLGVVRESVSFDWVADEIAAKCEVLPVPIDDVDAENSRDVAVVDPRPPIVLWNHRWEYDKAPEDFFAVVEKLVESRRDFRIAVTGEQFRNAPQIFAAARENLRPRIEAWGHLERDDYRALLGRTAIVVSTARQEFQGLSVLEAAANGAFPLVPDRLSYRELFPEACRYRDLDDLRRRLEARLDHGTPADRKVIEAARRFGWSEQKIPWENAWRRWATR